MQFINKNNPEIRRKALRHNRQIFVDWWNANGNYDTLEYSTPTVRPMIEDILECQDYFCCYCMRRLYLHDEINHVRNVSLEHIIPKKISGDKLVQELPFYRSIPFLSYKRVKVHDGGRLDIETKVIKKQPYPHILSFDNIVASCDAKLPRMGDNILSNNCCNNNRDQNLIPVVFYCENASELIRYSKDGKMDFDEEYAEFVGTKGANLTCFELARVRRFWCLISQSKYTSDDVRTAEVDLDMRDDIITSITHKGEIGRWEFLTENKIWCAFSDYYWFYEYYSKK